MRWSIATDPLMVLHAVSLWGEALLLTPSLCSMLSHNCMVQKPLSNPVAATQWSRCHTRKNCGSDRKSLSVNPELQITELNKNNITLSQFTLDYYWLCLDSIHLTGLLGYLVTWRLDGRGILGEQCRRSPLHRPPEEPGNLATFHPKSMPLFSLRIHLLTFTRLLPKLIINLELTRFFKSACTPLLLIRK